MPFCPLISFAKKERRYRRRQGEKKPVASTKIRELAYPSNHDGYVFAFYAERLGIRYEAELAARGLDKVVIGYRKAPPISGSPAMPSPKFNHGGIALPWRWISKGSLITSVTKP